MVVETRICTKCQTEKDIINFEIRSNGRRKQCVLCVSTRRALYYLKNKVEIIEKVKQYSLENKNKITKRANLYQKAHRISTRLHKIKWARKNKDKQRQYKLRRRAKEKSVLFEIFSRQDIISKYGNRCFYCLQGKFEHMDHYIPISKSGPHTLENISPACAFCNMSKHDKMPEDFERQMNFG